jgi:hypothetical protein
MKKILLLLILFSPFLILLLPSKQPEMLLLPSKNNKPNVYIFTSKHCPYSRRFREEFLPELKRKFAGEVNFLDLDTATAQGSSLYSKAAPQCMEQVGVPLLIAGNKCFTGYPYSIKEKSVDAINAALKANTQRKKTGK